MGLLSCDKPLIVHVIIKNRSSESVFSANEGTVLFIN